MTAISSRVMGSLGRKSSVWVVTAPWTRAVSMAWRHQRSLGTSVKLPSWSTSCHWKKRQRTETKAPLVMEWPRPKRVAVSPRMSPAWAERRISAAAQCLAGTSVKPEAAAAGAARESVRVRARSKAEKRRMSCIGGPSLRGAGSGAG